MSVSLHVKSHYSLGHGTASPRELVERASQLGLGALGLTDLETLSGQPQFHDLCRRHGIRPVTGVELRPGAGKGRGPFPRRGRLVLLARDRAGYENLSAIVSRRRGGAGTEAERQRARDAVQAVAERPEGLFVLTDDATILERLVLEAGIDRGAAGALLVRPAADSAGEAALLETARVHRVLPIADPEAVFPDPADYDLHLLLAAIRRGRPLAEMRQAADGESIERRLRGPKETALLYRDRPEALKNAASIAGECSLDLRPERITVPGAETLGLAAPAEELRRRCEAALAKGRTGGAFAGRRYDDRLERELDVIERVGCSGYFLAAAEIAAEARARGIPALVRGSALGSLTVHLLAISSLDPLEHGLLFERFLHPRRDHPPDIDLDVDSERREELLRWIRRRFGRDRVAMVGVHQRFRIRSALREGLKACGLGRRAIDRFCARLPGPEDPAGWPLDEEPVDLSSLPSELLPASLGAALPLVTRLVGKPRSLALHPGGVLIADRPIDAHVPVEAAARGLSVAQYDLRAVERTGLVKLDVLGNRGLTQVSEAQRRIRETSPDVGGAELPEKSPVPPGDPATLSRLDRAETIGCFQVETPAVRALLTKVRVASLDDCAAVLALVRPGAASGHVKRDYVRRMSGEEPAAPVHPVISAQLEETQGLLLYDEDLMRVLAAAGGLSLDEADELRSAIIEAGDDAGALRALEEHFLSRAAEQDDEPEMARAVWATTVKFAAYSFSKAHALSYAALAYESTYFKTHYPVEFGCALLESYGGAYPLRTVAADLSRTGVNLLPPSVSRSHRRSEVERGAIRVGLGAIKYLTAKRAEAILERRAEGGGFRDLGDFLDRVAPSRRETEALVRVGACDGLPPLSVAGYPFVHEALLKALRGELSPGAFEAIAHREPPAGPRAQLYRSLIRIQNELTYLDMHLSDHPMRVLRSEAQRCGCQRSDELRGRAAEGLRGRVRFAGIVAASRRHPIGGGRAMQFLTLEDEAGLLEAVILPPAYPRLAPQVTTPGPYLVEARLEEDRGSPQLVVRELAPFYRRGEDKSREVQSAKR